MKATSTQWSQAMGLAAPIVNAPMGGVAGGALAAAVSRAGGLGMIGIGSAGSADRLHTELRHVSDLADRPFGIGLISWAVAEQPRLLEAALAARPALLSVSFGDDWAWVRRAHDAGCVTATQVADVDGAQRAADAGVDVLVTRGAEAGGHGQPRVGTLPLLVEVLDRVAVPVLAAGGIASGRGLAAALAAGASGGWLGTAFAACPESTLPDAAAEVMLAARNTDTVTTRVFDIALGYPWPPTIPERVLRNAFTDSWHGRESELAADTEAVTELRAAIAADDYRLAPVNVGQGVSELTAIEPAARVIQRLCDEAREVGQQ
ncbi:MAG: nitronate monooxygenase [Mycolicibacterium vanbaalenii]|uniref:NAD(P)H-dependent flavin oxidoreductase n=1 Tax=Mycolicibacterium vanbaalenii TaxID=110539 RepID=UPI0035681161